MVFREGHDVPANTILEQGVRAKLGEPEANDIEIYTEYLDHNRFDSVSHHRLFRDYLREKYRDRCPDVIVTTVGFPTAGLSLYELIPGIPVVIMSALLTPPSQPISLRGTNVSGVEAHYDFRGTLDLIFQAQPATQRIVVIGGVALSDRSTLRQVETTSLLWSNRVEFEYWTNQPLHELQANVSRLPTGTVVLYTSVFRDISGSAFAPAQALELLLHEAAVPTYVLVDSQVGSGAVGGSVVSYAKLGACAGEITRRILDGEPVTSMPIAVLTNGTPLFDWRTLQRWGISESRLPPGSIIQFRQPTFWELYRWRIVAVGLFCCLQTALIVGLLVNRARKREAESVATVIAELSSSFINLPPGDVDREIENAQRRVCERLGLELSALWQWSVKDPEVLTMTHLYRPLGGPPVPERMNASEYFPWCLQQVREGRVIKFDSLEEAPPEAAGDLEAWRYYGLKNVLVIPLSTGGGSPFGCVSFHTVRAERAWPRVIVERLQLVAEVFANALERQHADQTLRESEARLDLAADSAEAGLWELDCHTGIFWATARARAIFGLTPEEIVSTERFEASVHPEDRALVRQAISRAINEREPINLEYRIDLENGRTRWIASRGRPQANETGTANRLLGVSVDITDRKQAEESLRELSGRLISAHEDERRRLARELHDDFSQRLALLSVEMEVLGSTKPGAERPSVPRLDEIALRVKELSSDVHRMAHQLHPAKLEQLGLVAAARRFCRELSAQSSVRIEFAPGPFPRDLPANAALCFYRVMQESLHNVVRHSSATEARVELRTESGRACLTVSDAGRGFDVQRAGRLGGLGLSSMQERVRLLAGVLTVKSAPGQGTHIEVRLPLTCSELAE